MSFGRYAEYKDSGVEWLGQVPAHWRLTRTKHVTNFTIGWTPPTGNDASYLGDNLWANISDLGPRVLEDTAKRISDSAIEESRISMSPKGSLLFSFKLSIGQVSIAGTDMFTNEAIATFAECSRLKTAFAYYALPLFLVQNASENIYGAKLLNQDLIKSAKFCLPAAEEQTAIAAFLDRETGKIDALVAEQQKLIALLKEKRQAVISHAVTKGLNPQAPMKPSGIEWLGDVPAHWVAPPLYLRYAVELGKMLDTNKISGEHLMPYLRNVDVQWGRICIEELPQMDIAPGEQERFSVREGDLLVCEGGEVGRAAVVGRLSISLGYQKALHRLRKLASDECPNYLFHVFRWAAATGMFSGEGQSTIAHLTGEQLRKYRFPKPPINEQIAIASFLGRETANFDALMIEQEKTITLLKERRSALISAAVTGQIDVRGFADKLESKLE